MRAGARSLAVGLVTTLVFTFSAAAATAQDQAPPELGRRPPADTGVPVDTVVLQGLDKITARISTFEAPLDQTVSFGSLEIVARTCHKTPPEEPPERAAFLEIVDVRPDSPSVALFTGWMFASSPALSSLEHPVYDVWVIDCILDGSADQAAETPAPVPSGEGSITIEIAPDSNEVQDD
ncbi:MAG: DUF2155 domain-containing protein [Kiloniellales bacterium]